MWHSISFNVYKSMNLIKSKTRHYNDYTQVGHSGIQSMTFVSTQDILRLTMMQPNQMTIIFLPSFTMFF